MATNNSFIIADTSGLISLAVTSDHNHDQAIAEIERLQGRQNNILVPYEVLVEMVNVLGKCNGHDKASTIWEYLSTTTLFLIVDSSRQAREKAAKQFETQPLAVSFTDCIVMAIADEYGTKEIFSFDKQFEVASYCRLKPSTEWKDAT